MAKKIIGGIGGVLGIGGKKKKAADPAATPAPTGPIIKSLMGEVGNTAKRKSTRFRDGVFGRDTILSDKLGS